jgi:thiol-disulfide isomerase/thioredoxin
MAIGLLVVVLALAVASVFGLWRKRTDGTVKVQPGQPLETADGVVDAGAPAPGEVLDAARLGRQLGERATLVQFSTVFCQPCRAAKVVLADVAERVPGVAHVELDAESHLDLVRELGIMRTPTTLILDGAGRITARAAGVPRKDQVLAALGASVK